MARHGKSRYRKLLDISAICGLVLFVVVDLGLYLYQPRFREQAVLAFLLFPVALTIAFIHKRRQTHPLAYMWLARIWCLTPIVGLVVVVGSPFFLNATLMTVLVGAGGIIAMYASVIVFARKNVLNIFQAANWPGLTSRKPFS